MGDFFREETRKDSVWGTTTTKDVFQSDFVRALRDGSGDDHSDLDIGFALTRLVYGELEEFGTSGHQRLNDEEIETAQRSLRSVLSRLAVPLELPWRNFHEFRAYWLQKGCANSWKARRDLLAECFQPVLKELERLDKANDRGQLTEGVSPHPELGWPDVDREIAALRSRFLSAQNEADYRDVGNRSVAVLEALSRTLYNPEVHLRSGETAPSADKTGLRLGRYVEDSLAGQDHELVRGVVKKTSELAHKVKHRPAATRRDAGIAADAVIMLANILRRVNQDM